MRLLNGSVAEKHLGVIPVTVQVGLAPAVAVP